MRFKTLKPFIFLLCLGAAFSLCAPHTAHARGPSLCKTAAPKSSVKLKTAKTKYIRTQSADTLTAMHNSGSGLTLGLAGGPIEIALTGRFIVHSRGNQSCVQLENLDVVLWAKPVIMIASNFKRGTCEYTQVLAHEQKHIRALRNFIRQQAPKLKRELRNILKTTQTRKTVSAAGAEAAKDQIQGRISNRLRAYQSKIMHGLEKTQAKIDSPEEYARVSAACRNWDKKLTSN